MKRNNLLKTVLLCLLVVFAGCKQNADTDEDVTPPSEVTEVNVKSSAGKIILTWKDPSDSDFYGVKVFSGYVENDKEIYNQDILVVKGTQKFELSHPENGKTYLFKLIAVDQNANESKTVFSERFTPSIMTQIISAGTYTIIHKRQSSIIITDYITYEKEENKKLDSDTVISDLLKNYSGFTFDSLSFDSNTLILNYSRNNAQEKFVKLNTGTVVKPISIPGSSFYYASEEYPVTINEFYLAKNEVTYAEWKEVYTWALSHEYTFDNPGQKGGGATHTSSDKEPVTCVNFRDAIVWCNAASEMEGLTPVYYYEDAGQNKTVKNTALVNAAKENTNASGLRLPTEAEWEYAARGGNPSADCWNYNYAGSNDIGTIAWYTENSDAHTHEVGQKPENAAGLYDMTGNVWEWTWWPLDSSLVGDYRFLRGGYWGDPAENSYIILRSMLDYTAQGDVAGFRVARFVK